jgi:GTP-binding protein Era
VSEFVSGFVSIVGRPNAGKSTLINALVGTKVAIVADKPQTTRTTIQGVLTRDHGQAIFLDTPGIHQANTPMNRRMMDAVRTALEDRDLLIFTAECTRKPGPEDREAVELLRRVETPAILALSKIDALKDKSRMLPLLETYAEWHPFRELIPISALTGEGIPELEKAIFAALPQGPQYFPGDHITDQPERFLAAELIREKILIETRQEVPHSVTVIIDSWDEEPDITRVAATIYVEREGQKGIIIGARGSMLKQIGSAARGEMESLLGRRFYVNLHVKVRPKWRENPTFLNTLDWRTMAGSDDT